MHETHHSNIIINNISDHYPSLLTIENPNLSKLEPEQIKTCRIKEKEINEIKNKISKLDWKSELESCDANQAFNLFHSKFTTILDQVAPKKIKKIRIRRNVPWFTLGLKKSNDRDKRLFKASQCVDATSVQKQKYLEYHKMLQKTKRMARQLYYRNLCKEFRYNSQKLWKLINSLVGKTNNKCEIVDHLKVADVEIHNGKEIATAFAKHFSSVGERFANKIPKSNKSCSDYLRSIPSSNNNLFLVPTTPSEILNIITDLPNKKSAGHDSINNILLKNLKTVLVEPLSIAFNKSMSEGTFPDLMKLADTVPLYKSKERYLVDNYRPISLLITLSKILENYSIKESIVTLKIII